jgi:hypothetical protein
LGSNPRSAAGQFQPLEQVTSSPRAATSSPISQEYSKGSWVLKPLGAPSQGFQVPLLPPFSCPASKAILVLLVLHTSLPHRSLNQEFQAECEKHCRITFKVFHVLNAINSKCLMPELAKI